MLNYFQSTTVAKQVANTHFCFLMSCVTVHVCHFKFLLKVVFVHFPFHNSVVSFLNVWWWFLIIVKICPVELRSLSIAKRNHSATMFVAIKLWPACPTSELDFIIVNDSIQGYQMPHLPIGYAC
jgi:hypothetical protein